MKALFGSIEYVLDRRGRADDHAGDTVFRAMQFGRTNMMVEGPNAAPKPPMNRIPAWHMRLKLGT